MKLNMKTILTIYIFFISSLSYAGGIYIDKDSALQISGKKEWVFSDFEKYGYKVTKDYEVYLSEGVMSDSKDNYNISIMKNEKHIAYFEIIENEIWRGILLSKTTPIYTKENSKKLYLGKSLVKTIKTLGEFINNGSGDESGNYLSFPTLNRASFYTSCSLNNPYEQTEAEKKMSKTELYKHCKIDRMLFFGNKGKVSFNQ